MWTAVRCIRFGKAESDDCLMLTFVEEIVEEQRLKIFLLLEGGSDVFQEYTLKKSYQMMIENRGMYIKTYLNDATSAPHTGDPSIVQSPVQLFNFF